MGLNVSIHLGENGFYKMNLPDHRAGQLTTFVDSWLVRQHIQVGDVAVRAVGGWLEPPITNNADGYRIVCTLAQDLLTEAECESIHVVDDRPNTPSDSRVIVAIKTPRSADEHQIVDLVNAIQGNP